MELIIAILRFLTPGRLTFAGAAIIPLVLLIVPDTVATWLGIDSFRHEFRQWLAVIMVGGAVMTLLTIPLWVPLYKHGRVKLTSWRLWRQYKSLSDVEKAVLVGPVWHNDPRFIGPLHHAALQGLVDKNFIHAVSPTGHTNFIYEIPQGIQFMVMAHRSTIRDINSLGGGPEVEKMVQLIGGLNGWLRR